MHRLDTKKGRTKCVITFADRALWRPGEPWIGRRTTPSFDTVTMALCGWSTATSTQAPSMTDICAGSEKLVLRNTLPSPSGVGLGRWCPLFCSRVLVSSYAARAAFAKGSQVSISSCSGKCQVWARGSDRCGAPNAAQSAFHFACPAGGSTAISTTATPPCPTLAVFPPRAPQSEATEADHGHGPL